MNGAESLAANRWWRVGSTSASRIRARRRCTSWPRWTRWTASAACSASSRAWSPVRPTATGDGRQAGRHPACTSAPASATGSPISTTRAKASSGMSTSWARRDVSTSSTTRRSLGHRGHRAPGLRMGAHVAQRRAVAADGAAPSRRRARARPGRHAHPARRHRVERGRRGGAGGHPRPPLRASPRRRSKPAQGAPHRRAGDADAHRASRSASAARAAGRIATATGGASSPRAPTPASSAARPRADRAGCRTRWTRPSRC